MGLPTWAMVPLSRATILSAMVMASTWSWVTYTMVAPRRLCRREISMRIWTRREASRFDRGSSNRNTSGSRTMVREPEVFLFDEPLSNLDASLRVQMRIEISRLHKRLGATMVYVTHDQVEAMTM